MERKLLLAQPSSQIHSLICVLMVGHRQQTVIPFLLDWDSTLLFHLHKVSYLSQSRKGQGKRTREWRLLWLSLSISCKSSPLSSLLFFPVPFTHFLEDDCMMVATVIRLPRSGLGKGEDCCWLRVLVPTSIFHLSLSFSCPFLEPTIRIQLMVGERTVPNRLTTPGPIINVSWRLTIHYPCRRQPTPNPFCLVVGCRQGTVVNSNPTQRISSKWIGC